MRLLLGKALWLSIILIIVLQTAPGVIAQESPYRLTWSGCAAGVIGYHIPSLHKHSKKIQHFTYTFAENSMTIRYWL